MAACYPSVSTKPHRGHIPTVLFPFCSHSQEGRNVQQHFNCFCSNIRASCTFWTMRCGILGRCGGGKQPLSLLLLTLPGHQWPRHAHDEEAKPITMLRLKHKEMMAPLCPSPPDPGAEISSLAYCHPQGGAEDPPFCSPTTVSPPSHTLGSKAVTVIIPCCWQKRESSLFSTTFPKDITDGFNLNAITI